MELKERSCADCGVINCDVQNKKYPPFCLTTENYDEKLLKDSLMEYEKEENKEIM